LRGIPVRIHLCPPGDSAQQRVVGTVSTTNLSMMLVVISHDLSSGK
jgi:hypothetical protein